MTDETKARLGEAMRELGLFSNAKLLNAADAHVRAVVEEMLQAALSPGTCITCRSTVNDTLDGECWRCWVRKEPRLDPDAETNRILLYKHPQAAAPARLDPSGTATGKTILTAPIVGRTTQHPGPASAHVDLETGVRTELREEGEDWATTLADGLPWLDPVQEEAAAAEFRRVDAKAREEAAAETTRVMTRRMVVAVTEAKAAALRWVLYLDIQNAPRAARAAICNEIGRLEATLKGTP